MDFPPELIITFITLTLLEIVLGIDNLIFIALIIGRLPAKFNHPARVIGLSLAFLMRVIMLFGINQVMLMTKPVFAVDYLSFSIKDLLLSIGGLFLIIKAYTEIRKEFTNKITPNQIKIPDSFSVAIIQIAFIDFIFSFDSIITAVGLTRHINLIIAAIAVSMIIMLFTTKYLAEFLHKYPRFKILGLSFIMLIGIVLAAEGVHIPVNKNYVYAALIYALIIEVLNSFIKKRHQVKFKV